MKKLIIFLLLAALIFTSACSGEVLQEEPKATVSGSFTACVRNIIPDYVFDDFTPSVAVLTEFQSRPFTVFVGEEIAKQLEIGKVYVFTIDPITAEYTKEELSCLSLASLAQELPGFKIVSFRPAEEHETGLESLSLTIE